MSGGHRNGVIDRVRTVFVDGDGRLRAVFRVALAWPILWFLAGSAGVFVGDAVTPTGSSASTTMLFAGIGQSVGSLVALLVWARFVDRRAVANYGFATRPQWVLDLVVGFLAVLVGSLAWVGLGSVGGWIDVEVVASTPTATTSLAIATVLVAFLVNVAVQETVCVGVILTNASEGLTARGIDPTWAVVVGWIVSTTVFMAKHRPTTADRAAILLAGLGVFSLLYVLSGELAISIGVHFGVNYVSDTVFTGTDPGGATVLLVDRSLSGGVERLAMGYIPQLLIALVLLAGWLAWQRDGLGIRADIARWTPLGAGKARSTDGG